MALSLTITGLYALPAQLVPQRALRTFTGTAVGMAASAAVARLLTSIGPTGYLDARTLIGVATATFVLAYRAVRIDAVGALRAE